MLIFKIINQKYNLIHYLVILLLFILFNSDFALAELKPDTTKFPEDIFIKTRTETFNSRAYFILKGGRIWTKINQQTNKVKDKWHLMPPNGLPFSESEKDFPFIKEMTEIYADADELLAIDREGRFFVKQSKSNAPLSDNLWHYNVGFPKQPLHHNDLTFNNRSVTMGRRHFDVMWYEDIFGNRHNYGTMGTSTIYILAGNGQEVYFTDNGLPSDFSHTICGPVRGKFIAENLQASAGTMFVINSNGEMYTKMEDFDLNGGTAMFYNYTYKPYKSNLSGDDFKSGITPFGLPLKDWYKQPNIVLKDKAKITRNITILQNGHGNSARELRVAGIDQNGNHGYYSKNIFAENWKFYKADLRIENKDFLIKKPGYGYSKDLKYTGSVNFLNNISYEAELSNFNMECSPTALLIQFDNVKVPVKLHTIEAWTYFKRLDPGRDGTYKVFLGTLEIHPDHLNLVPEEIKKLNLDTFSFSVSATLNKIYIQLNKDQSINMEFDLAEKLPDFMISKIKAVTKLDPSKYVFMEDFDTVIKELDFSDNLLEKKLDVNHISQLKKLIKKVEHISNAAKKVLNIQKEVANEEDILYYFYGAFEKAAHLLQVDKITNISNGTTLLEAYHNNQTRIIEHFKKGLDSKSTEINSFVSDADKKLLELEFDALFTEQKYSGHISIPKHVQDIPAKIPAFSLSKKQLNIIIDEDEQYDLTFLRDKNMENISFPIKMEGNISVPQKPAKGSIPLFFSELKDYFDDDIIPVKIHIERDNIKIISEKENISIFLQRSDRPI